MFDRVLNTPIVFMDMYLLLMYLRAMFLALSNILDIHCTKKKFSIKDFFSKCDQIRSLLRICLHLLKKSLMGNFIFCAVI